MEVPLFAAGTIVQHFVHVIFESVEQKVEK
jgi:hypothetical protein